MSCEEERERLAQARGELVGELAAYENCETQIPDQDCPIFGIAMAQAKVEAAEQVLSACEAEHEDDDPPLRPRILRAEGYVIFLRVHDLNTGYGPDNDRLKGEVIFKLDGAPERAFGFKLQDNENEPVRRGMLSLLESALIHKILVRADYIESSPSQKNHRAFRIELRKPSLPAPDPRDPDTLVARD